MNHPTHGCISVGADVVDVPRVAKLYARYGAVFLDRVFIPQEVQYCFGFRNPMPSLAARFAAKEAAAKALGVGIGSRLSWTSVAVGRTEAGAPYLILDELARSCLQEKGGVALHVSLSHTLQVALAFVVCVGWRPGGEQGVDSP